MEYLRLSLDDLTRLRDALVPGEALHGKLEEMVDRVSRREVCRVAPKGRRKAKRANHRVEKNLVVDLLKKDPRGPWNATDVAEEMGVTRRQAMLWLNKLARVGRIQRVGYGLYKANPPAIAYSEARA